MVFRIILLIFSFLFAVYAFGQENRLAAEYFRYGEYDKAAALYFQLYKSSNNTSYFVEYYKSLLFSERYDEAMKAVDNHLKSNQRDIHINILKGHLYERTQRPEEAEKYYQIALDKIGNNNINVIQVGNTFLDFAKYDHAVSAYKIGSRSGQDPSVFYRRIGDIYSMKGDSDNMVDYYLLFLESDPNVSQANAIKNNLARQLGISGFKSLETKLIRKIQENPDNVLFIDLLSWVYIQADDYERAFRQITALDRRFSENGNRVYRLAEDAKRAGQYQMAAKAFKYIIDNKETNSPFFMNSASSYLAVMSDIIKLDTNTTRADLIHLEELYNNFIGIYGISSRSSFLVLGLAELQALYLNEIDKAIGLLHDFIERRNVDQENKAKAKLALGDYYLIKGEVWEASLLYSQVDKAFTEGELGETARFKNAKLYYYTGDFEWAQIIFNILKPATTRLISNDAIEASVFISEAMGEDSLNTPLMMFAGAELLVFQNRFNEAIAKFDSVNYVFPDNNIEDYIWYQKAQIYKKLKNFEMAKTMLNQIIEKYPDKLKADDAIFELAEIYEKVYVDPLKAKDLYEKLFMEYPFSTKAIEARNKFRDLYDEPLP
jgi:tetratricopeptide (TPR) repeat protein